ncbi:MAG: hypothetical protein AAF197_10210 [Pseudomonadota bacterium]
MTTPTAPSVVLQLNEQSLQQQGETNVRFVLDTSNQTLWYYSDAGFVGVDAVAADFNYQSVTGGWGNLVMAVFLIDGSTFEAPYISVPAEEQSSLAYLQVIPTNGNTGVLVEFLQPGVPGEEVDIPILKFVTSAGEVDPGISVRRRVPPR